MRCLGTALLKILIYTIYINGMSNILSIKLFQLWDFGIVWRILRRFSRLWLCLHMAKQNKTSDRCIFGWIDEWSVGHRQRSYPLSCKSIPSKPIYLQKPHWAEMVPRWMDSYPLIYSSVKELNKLGLVHYSICYPFRHWNELNDK